MLHTLKNPNNKTLVIAVSIIFLVGLIALSSAASGAFFLKQFIFGLVSAAIVFVLYRIFSLDFFLQNSTLIYFLNIALLLSLKILGSTILGSQRWLRIGPISIQPSEIAKVCLIIYLAAWLSRHPIRGYGDILKTLAVIALPAGLVLIQPDLGTTLVYIAICFGMLFWAGAKLIELLVLVSPLLTAIFSSFGKELLSYNYGDLHFALTLPFVIFLFILLTACALYYKAWRSPWISTCLFGLVSFNLVSMVFKTIAWGFLKEYQQKRLVIFVDPYSDPLGAGYHIIQSLYAIGSGGIFGQGYKAGNLTQGRFVPEQHTDFIFSSIGEEFGLLGSLLVISLYAVVLLTIISIAKESQHKFPALICIGTFSMLIFHIFVNIGMNLSVMPITGVPLPFFSYGGSSLIVDLFLVSLVLKSSLLNKNLL